MDQNIVNYENHFLCEAMLMYTKNRRISEISSDIDAYIMTIRERILKTTDHPFCYLEGQPSFLGTGSASEGLGVLGNDTDVMAISPIDAVSFTRKVPKENILIAETTRCRKGFCYLTVTPQNQSFFKLSDEKIQLVEGDKYFLKRNALIEEMRENTEYLQPIETQGPSFKLPGNIDHVPAIKCLDWPSECDEYFERDRFWPKQEIVQQIRNDGMHIVFKSFSEEPTLDDPLEFRTSFSLAERTLIRSISDIQFATYYFLKVIKNDITGDDPVHPLKSYYIKTILMHFIESSCPGVWTVHNFYHNAKLCFEKLLDCYKKKSLPHIFIKDLNLLSKYSTKECQIVTKELSEFVNNWTTEIHDIFFQDIARTKNTQLKSTEVQEMYKDSFGPDFFIDHLSECLEAEFLPFVSMKHAIGEGMLKALEETIDTIEDFIPAEFIIIYKILLKRALWLGTWVNERSPANEEYLVENLRKHNEVLIYPINGYVDCISSKLWLAFYSYMFGDEEETEAQINSISGLDDVSPVGCMGILMSITEAEQLEMIDPFLSDFLFRYLEDNDEDFCVINCVVLAHYLRAKIMDKDHLGNHVLEKRLQSVRRVQQIIMRVWKRETYRSALMVVIEEVVELLI